jgi:uncharacterized protein YndB with AHSA1/START domain
MTEHANIVTEPGLTIERIFEAPVGLVWQAWTRPEHLEKWHGPEGYSAPFIKNDLRIGGTFLFCMRSAEGQDIWSTGTYTEVIEHKRIVATDCFADADGNIVPATYYGMPDTIPLEMETTVTFEDVGGRTKLTLIHAGLPVGEMTDGASIGWNQSLDKLAAHLATP